MSDSEPSFRLQAGVIPYRRTARGLEILLVTSRTRKRWIIPKGNIESDRNVPESVSLEAYEEAGVQGHIDPLPIGSYRHDSRKRPTLVQVFVMEVERQLSDAEWPESARRTREWVTPDEARERVLEDGLKELFIRMSARLTV